jgi:transketolase
MHPHPVQDTPRKGHYEHSPHTRQHRLAAERPVDGGAERRPADDDADRPSLRRQSIRARQLILEMIQRAGSGHIGSSLSCVDIISTLKFSEMNWTAGRDRGDSDVFVLSKGHAVPAWYAVLMVSGELSTKHLGSLRKVDSPLQGHPDRVRNTLVDVSTGALGQGLSVAIGRAHAKKMKSQKSCVYCLLGDGECQEGQIWEAVMFAGALGIGNLIAFIDLNESQSDGPVQEVLDIGPLAPKLMAFGWHVQVVDGHSHQDLRDAARVARDRTDQPSAIIARTRKGHIDASTVACQGKHSGTLTWKEFRQLNELLEAAL